MTKAELIERIAQSRDLPPDITKKDIAQILGLAFVELATYFSKTKVTRSNSPRFTFPRFGTFTKKKRSARRGVNPRTLEPIQIDACHTLDFKASRELREAMNPATTRRTKTTGGKARSSGTRNGKRAAKTETARGTASSRSRRRLTPRDEDAELDALIADDAVYEEPTLPSAPLQRVRSARGGSSRARTG